MDKPFEIGEKVRCVKRGDWRIDAGLGEKSNWRTPVYGEVYTVSFIDRLVPKAGENTNGIEWAMTLEEFPEDAPTTEPHNVFSCRRFEKV